jgi:hypothetical protein
VIGGVLGSGSGLVGEWIWICDCGRAMESIVARGVIGQSSVFRRNGSYRHQKGVNLIVKASYPCGDGEKRGLKANEGQKERSRR